MQLRTVSFHLVFRMVEKVKKVGAKRAASAKRSKVKPLAAVRKKGAVRARRKARLRLGRATVTEPAGSTKKPKIKPVTEKVEPVAVEEDVADEESEADDIVEEGEEEEHEEGTDKV